MKSTYNKICYALLVLAVVAVTLISGFAQALMMNVGISYAIDDTVYSNVLDDLHKDETFNENNYPEIEDDYSLEVIQIAESVDDELFIYVYQPSGNAANLRATSINISKGYKTLKFYNYTLSFLNNHNTLYKYKVNDFQIEDAPFRYYDITSIYRAWNKDLGDDETDNDNTISEVPYSVSKIYKLGIENGEFIVESKPTDTITITSKYVGFVRYENGYKLYKSACDSHFVAFSTDIPIDELQEADIYYTAQSYSSTTNMYGHISHNFGEILPYYSYVTDKQDIQYKTDGWFNVGTINRERIVKVDDFIAAENFSKIYPCGVFDVEVKNSITQDGVNELKKCDWVVRFAETKYEYSPMASNYLTYSIVGDVSILRLEGISNGDHFNLGVIDNKQTGSGKPVNDTEIKVTLSEEFSQFWKMAGKIIAIVLAVIAVILLIMFVPGVLNVVLFILKIIFAPFKWICKGIKSLAQKKKSRGRYD